MPVLLLLLALLLPGPARAAPACGMNHSFVAIDLDALPRCSATDEAATIAGQGFLPRWSEPGMRERVRAQLAQMHADGMRALRVLVFFGEWPDATPADIFHPARDAERAAHATAEFLRDAADAGFSELVLAFGPLALSTPGCRRVEWADCFDLGTLPNSAAFSATVAVAAARAVPAVVIDLVNEGCTAPGMPARLRAAAARYGDAVAAALAAALPPGTEVTMSAILQLGLPCVRNTLALLNAHGLRGGPVDVHVYDVATAALIPAAAAMAAADGRRLIIGEVGLGGPSALHEAVAAAIAASPPDSVRAVMFWPVGNMDARCHATMAPPWRLPSGPLCPASR
jgi:hypothetical protein